MTEKLKRREDRIFDPSYVEGLEALSTDELRSRRAECEQFEDEISFARQLLRGKIDIIRDSLASREDGDASELKSLIERLPKILGASGERPRPFGAGKHKRVGAPAGHDRARREVEQLVSEDTLAHLEKLSVAELEAITEKLEEAERETSERRQQVFTVLDQIQGEFVRRFKDGQEDPTAALRN